ncbi:MAG: chemotaxis protein CheW [Oculatellaceae cyanobacterium Prado106]|jgi:chemotaxis signal transduction protein|nr:chemotaxis protein CheW [Oculatellaceae cyanobacterium Prado106]
MVDVLNPVEMDSVTREEIVSFQGEFSSLAALFTEIAPVVEGQKFLRLQLGTEHTTLLAVDEIAAVVTIAIPEIVPVPHMPGCVLGLYNWRGDMLWLVDLGHQAGFSPMFSPLQGVKEQAVLREVSAVVVESEGRNLGFCVRQVFDIELHDSQLLHEPAPEMFSAQFLPFVKGYLTGDRTTILNVPALLQDPTLQVHHAG